MSEFVFSYYNSRYYIRILHCFWTQISIIVIYMNIIAKNDGQILGVYYADTTKYLADLYWAEKVSGRTSCIISSISFSLGMTGQPIILKANYYQMNAQPDWAFCMYHVDFRPSEERTTIKKLLLRQHTQALGNYIFDGNQLYTSHKLQQDVCVHLSF